MGLEVKSVTETEDCLWSGGVHVTLDCPVEQAWGIFGDFGGLCKWNPSVAVCDIVEGKGNEPRSVRYCSGTLADSWVYERLLERDENKYFLKYQMEENRFRFPDGIQGYVSQAQFHDGEDGKTVVDWTYTVQPVATQTYEQFTNFMTGFYLYNLNILQSAANTAVGYSKPQEQSQNHSPICTTKVARSA
ncbi:hypothetical protein M758_4G064500 [Ceratodon purpureus]|nr:hypothetical protein M758_4G064500 [Ceratodon purpureus]